MGVLEAETRRGAVGHHPAASLALVERSPDRATKASGPRKLSARRLAGRERSAGLIAESFLAYGSANVARALGLTRQSVHLWGTGRDRGVSLSDLLAGPRPWAGMVLRRALACVDGSLPCCSLTPQSLVARIVAGAAQIAVIIEQKDLDGCTPEQLDEMDRVASQEADRLEQLRRQIAAARNKKGRPS